MSSDDRTLLVEVDEDCRTTTSIRMVNLHCAFRRTAGTRRTGRA